jgi:hypothetical protein
MILNSPVMMKWTEDLEDAEIEAELEDKNTPEIDIAAMAQEAIVSEITKALKK